MAREGHGADGKSVYAKKIGTGSVMPVAAKKMGLKGSATRKSNVDTTLTKLPATVKEAHRLDSRERGRLNTMLRNAFFAEFGLSIKDVRGLGAAGIKATLDRVRRDDRWQSSAFCDIKPTGLGPL